MFAIDARWLARGIALAISLATSQAGACVLHTMTLDGFETAHPAAIQVSLATRKAIDDKRISDIPRETRESRLSALADIERTFHAFGLTAMHQGSSSTPVFSIYLTESDHWIAFTPAESGWAVQLHRSGQEESAVVIVVSDTAMKGLLLNQLSFRDAHKLGMLMLTGGEVDRYRVSTAIQDALARFHATRIQSAGLD
jgi:hypothetical protein